MQRLIISFTSGITVSDMMMVRFPFDVFALGETKASPLIPFDIVLLILIVFIRRLISSTLRAFISPILIPVIRDKSI